MLGPSQTYEPPLIKGMTVHPENPLLFDFIVDPGDSDLRGPALNQEALKMVEYFMASLTIPDDQMWVNLSPYEKDKIVSEKLGETTMGRDLLAQDYILKQMTASLLYPENDLGKKFWEKVYRMAYERFGTTKIPVETFNKVWIVPRRAAVYENGASVFVVSRDLRVMLEEDYMAMDFQQKSAAKSRAPARGLAMEHNSVGATGQSPLQEDLSISSQIIREIIIPELEKEVNEGKHFAELRQIYNAMILAKWYKENLRETLLGKVYTDQNKIKGIDVADRDIKEKIYQQYLKAFQQGVYNFIKEEYDIGEKTVIPRKYFSGGMRGLEDITLERHSSPVGLEPTQRGQLPQNSRALKLTVALVENSRGIGNIAASSPVEIQDSNQSGERDEVLKERYEYYSDKFNTMLKAINNGVPGAEDVLVKFINETGAILDLELADIPVEAHYPPLKAAALLEKKARILLINTIQNRIADLDSTLGEAILMMYNLIPENWMEENVPEMIGRVIYSVSPENLLLAGGLGYVMQVHEKFMIELGARVVSIEPMYKSKKDEEGNFKPIDYAKMNKIDNMRVIGETEIQVGAQGTGVRFLRGTLPTGKDVMFIEEVPKEGQPVRYTNSVYDYGRNGNQSWEEFSAFFSKSVIQLIRLVEQERKMEEGKNWRPAVVWSNDSQAAGAMALVIDAKDKEKNDEDSVLKDIYPVFTTHTFGNRQNFSIDQIDRVLGWLLGLDKKWYSAAVKFDKMDMASLAIRLVENAGGVVNMVSRKHKFVLDRTQIDPNVHTFAITNGDDLKRVWSLVKQIYKDLYGHELKDPDDLTWQEAQAIKQAAVQKLNSSFMQEGGENLGLDPQKPIVSYAGRLVSVKISPYRTFTEKNIRRLVADGYNVVLFGRLQGYDESMNLANQYQYIQQDIKNKKAVDPAGTKGWGKLVFKGQYTDAQKQLMLIASDLVALDSDNETGTSEWTEVNGAIALSWILASPWRLQVSPSKVIKGEGIIGEANEEDINMIIPQGANEEDYYVAMKTKLQEAISDPENFYRGAIRSAKLAQVVNGLNTAAAYLRIWNDNLESLKQQRASMRLAIKQFSDIIEEQELKTVLETGRNGVTNFIFRIPDGNGVNGAPNGEIPAHGGLASFIKAKHEASNYVFDGALSHLLGGHYWAYLKFLLDDVSGHEIITGWIDRLMQSEQLSPYKKDLLFTEFIENIVKALTEKKNHANASAMISSPVGGIDLNSTLLDLQIKRDDNGIPLPLPQQPIEQMHIDGFLPVIINVTPFENMSFLLGKN
ncbi:MAG: glycogen/starch synthase [Candidatus Omnitrophica bacterium]|nr:glycogen/starch synthase [Candidatus Omnitrophota bacterium]